MNTLHLGIIRSWMNIGHVSVEVILSQTFPTNGTNAGVFKLVIILTIFSSRGLFFGHWFAIGLEQFGLDIVHVKVVLAHLTLVDEQFPALLASKIGTMFLLDVDVQKALALELLVALIALKGEDVQVDEADVFLQIVLAQGCHAAFFAPIVWMVLMIAFDVQ